MVTDENTWKTREHTRRGLTELPSRVGVTRTRSRTCLLYDSTFLDPNRRALASEVLVGQRRNNVHQVIL